MAGAKELVVNQGAMLTCPHCAKAQESVVEDYVVPGRVGAGSATIEQCEHCDDEFEVMCLGDDQYRIRPVAG